MRAAAVMDNGTTGGGFWSVIAASVAAFGSIVVAAFQVLARRTSKQNGVGIKEFSERAELQLTSMAQSLTTIANRFERFEVGTTLRLDRLEQEVNSLQALQKLEPAIQVVRSKLEDLEKDLDDVRKRLRVRQSRRGEDDGE